VESIDPIVDRSQRFPIEEFEVFKPKEKRKPLSLLSGDAIADIAKVVEKAPDVINQPLALLMTVTNLQGLILQNPNDPNSKSISNAEYRQFLFYPGLLDKKREFQGIWDKAILSSRASGAFPVAFPPLKDASSSRSFNLQYISDDYFSDRVNHIFNSQLPVITSDNKIDLSYSDGGILDNLPILKGINLEAAVMRQARQSDTSSFDSSSSDTDSNLTSRWQPSQQKHENVLLPNVESDNNYQQFSESLLDTYPELKSGCERLHVYVQPNPVSSIKSSPRLTQTHFTMLELLMSGLTLPHSEHEAIQLKNLIDIEEKVKLKKSLLENITDPNIRNQLNEAIPYNPVKPSPISPLIINKIKEAQDSPEDKETNVRLRQLYPIYRALLTKKDIRVGLESKDPSKLLISDFIGAFGGFFDRRYREHDFLLGRICGVTWLTANLGIEYNADYINGLAGEINNTILAKNPSIEDLTWSVRARLFRIVLRFIRIAVLESKSSRIRNIWDVLYLPLALMVAVILRLIDFATTLFLYTAFKIETISKPQP
jgi:hypothetical protein